jgi:hypothetical protein
MGSFPRFPGQPSSIQVLGPHVRGFTAPAFIEFVETDGFFVNQAKPTAVPWSRVFVGLRYAQAASTPRPRDSCTPTSPVPF